MQGERGRIGSLPETLEINHGSASSNASIDQQLRWNDMRNPAGNQIRDYILSPGDMNAAYLNSVNQERQMSTSWSLGEPSSSNSQSEVRFVEQKAELGWSSSESGCPRAGPRLEERSFEPPNTFSVGNVNSNPLFVQSSNSDMFTQSLNNGGDGQVVLSSNIQKSSGSGNQWISPAGGSDQRACGYLIEDNDGRPGCSMEGCRLSRKRKAIEANIGQSSVSGSSSYLQRTDNNAWSAVPASYNLSSNLGASAPLEQVNPRLTLGATEVTSDDIPNLCGAGSSHRNSRLRINTQNQLASIPPTLFSTEGAVGHSSFSSSHLSQRQLPGDYSLNLRSASTAGNMIPRSQPVLIHVPALPRNVQAHRWNGGSSSGAGSSTNSIVSGDRDAILHAERGSRSMRNVLDNPMFVSAGDVRNQIQNPANRSSTAVNLGMPGNVASTSRTSASSIGHPSSAPLVLRENPLRFPRRLSICRTLFSSAGSDSGGQSSNHSPLRSGHGSSQEMGFSSVPANQGHPQPHPRSALWTERQGNSGLGIPYLLRPSSAAGGGSGRLVSEIRNALGLMRRGESLRYEDVMILDQSVYFGVADFLDRHGDMRLDVDNMSYEELLALEERIGNVSTGLNEETIVNRLKRRKCSTIIGSPLEAEPCCICQEEYSEGEDLGTLQCGHDFHAECIKQWLMHKNLCPICKTTALEK